MVLFFLWIILVLCYFMGAWITPFEKKIYFFYYFRPRVKELLAKEFFAEDTGFKVELAQRDALVNTDKNQVNFRLR